MIVSLLLVVVVVVLVVMAGRKVAGRGGGAVAEAHAIRRFFQYALLFALLVVTSVGLSGLLGRALDRAPIVALDDTALARNLAFTVVGLPLYLALALWSRRRLLADPLERVSVGWALYMTAASLTSLVVAMTSLQSVLAWAVDVGPHDPTAVARVVVWGAVWGGHWWLHGRLVPADRSRLHHLGGSLTGLVTAMVGLAGLLGAALSALMLSGGDAVLTAGDEAWTGAIALAVGAPVWVLYWVRTAARSERDPLWFGYVLLAGIGASLVVALVSASTVLYSTLVWLLGDPQFSDATRHFNDAPWAAGAALTGAVAWWYHQAVLEEAHLETRTEVRRVYEYLMSAIGLLAAAAGLTVLVVAGIEALTHSEAVILDQSAVNTLLASATLLLVGVPVWWFYWHRIQRAAAALPEQEHASPTRRAYLLVLFGIGGVAAVIALLVGVYLLFEDVVQGTFGAETIRSMRVPIGILLSTGAIAGYHWAVYQSGRAAMPAPVHGPRYVLLVGPPDPGIAKAVAHATGGRVQAWSTDDGGAPWSVDEVMAALATAPEGEVLVLSDGAGLHAIPVHRT
jgi:hypothetical protein